MQAVHLSGGALTLGLAAALLCAGCAPLPSVSQGSSAPQVSTVSASLSQVSSNFGGPGLRLKALQDHQKALPLQP